MLRRTPLRRKVGLKRTQFKRKAARPNPAGSDPAHLAWTREQPCCVCLTYDRVEAHHSTVGRGLGQKTSDRETMPLCWKCHRVEFHGARGYFAGWTRTQRREWQRSMSALYARQKAS